jgi:hypothetical protein
MKRSNRRQLSILRRPRLPRIPVETTSINSEIRSRRTIGLLSLRMIMARQSGNPACFPSMRSMEEAVSLRAMSRTDRNSFIGRSESFELDNSTRDPYSSVNFSTSPQCRMEWQWVRIQTNIRSTSSVTVAWERRATIGLQDTS